MTRRYSSNLASLLRIYVPKQNCSPLALWQGNASLPFALAMLTHSFVLRGWHQMAPALSSEVPKDLICCHLRLQGSLRCTSAASPQCIMRSQRLSHLANLYQVLLVEANGEVQ